MCSSDLFPSHDKFGAGCVANMSKSKDESVASRELQINDILNSKMANKVKELFEIRKITVKSKS